MRSLKPLIICSLIFFLYSQAKAQYDFTVSVTEGCTPLKVKFKFVSTATVDSVDTYYWSFGNGTTTSEMDPDTVVYDTEGEFDVTLILVFADGYEDWIDKPGLIITHQAAAAGFEYSTPTNSLLYYLFKQNSVSNTDTTYQFKWEVADEAFPDLILPEQPINFPRVDSFLVTLTVTDQYGCSSSSTRMVAIIEEIQVPNFFTPGGDGTNDFFLVESKNDIPLRIKIFTRTGILVYEAEGPVISWDGETASGDKLKTGVYYYSLEAIHGDPQKRYTKTGFFHMYRQE